MRSENKFSYQRKSPELFEPQALPLRGLRGQWLFACYHAAVVSLLLSLKLSLLGDGLKQIELLPDLSFFP